MQKRKGIKTYYLMGGHRGQIVKDYVVAVEEQEGAPIVRYADGGWNLAVECFFTEEQCRRYHGLPQEEDQELLKNISTKLMEVQDLIDEKLEQEE